MMWSQPGICGQLGVERIAAYAVELMHAKLAGEEIPPESALV